MTPGMTITLDGQIYRVESCMKVNVAKGSPFVKTKLRNLTTNETIEKNFKLGQDIQEVHLTERQLEYLYLEGKDYLFLDVDNLELVRVAPDIIGEKIDYLKEGIEVKAKLDKNSVSSIELPQFLELMVLKTDPVESSSLLSNASKFAVVETGARIKVPLFVEPGDIIKVDTDTREYIQRV